MKKVKVLYVILFVLICFLPLILMPFFKNDASIEKRELAEFPAFIKEGKFNVDFSTEFESWFNDRLPLRAYLLSASNYIKSEILKAPSSNVIVGKDGWLFYETESADYMNTNQLTESQINSVGITLSLIEESVKSKGGNFTFVALPNKASVYDEYMPSNYKKSDDNNLTLINKKLDELKVNHVDMLKVMRENKEKGVYHRRDSHWNYQGALIGYNSIMDSLSKEHKTYSDASYTIKTNWRADLDKLLYPVGGFMDDQYYYDIDFSSFKFEGTRGLNQDSKAQLELYMSDKEQGDDNFRSLNSNVKDDKKLFMARDSFGRAILPYFIDNYKDATFRRTDNPDIVSIGNNTDFVYEIVERNLNRVIATAPFLYAPVRNSIQTKSLNYVGEIDTCDYSIEGYGVRIYGAIDDSIIINDRIYVELSNDKSIVTYEAFPICEKKLLNVDNKNGYSMYIDKNEGLEGNFDVKIIIGNNYYNAGKISLEYATTSSKAESIIEEKVVNDEVQVIKYNGNSFSIGDKYDSIKNNLGAVSKPSETSKVCNPNAKGDATSYYYDGLTITTNYNGDIVSASISSSNASLALGNITVGDLPDKCKEYFDTVIFESEYGSNYSEGNYSVSVIFDEEGCISNINLEDMTAEY